MVWASAKQVANEGSTSLQRRKAWGYPPSCPPQCSLEEREGEGKAPQKSFHFPPLAIILPSLSNALGECLEGASCRWDERWASVLVVSRMPGVQLPAGCKQFGQVQKHTASVCPHQLLSLHWEYFFLTCGWPPLHWLMQWRSRRGRSLRFSWRSTRRCSPGVPLIHPTPCSCQPVLRLRGHGGVYSTEAEPSPQMDSVDNSSIFVMLQVCSRCTA